MHVFMVFVVFDLVFSVLSHEIGWEECLQDDLQGGQKTGPQTRDHNSVKS